MEKWDYTRKVYNSGEEVLIFPKYTSSALPVLRSVDGPVALLGGAVPGFVGQHLELGLKAEV